jgi:hypothetical protein
VNNNKKGGVSKGHPLFFIEMFISFAPPKEMNQRKGGRKRQPHQFVAYCTMPFPAPTNMVRFAPFPVCLRTITPCKLLITNEKKGDASPFKDLRLM